MKKRRCLLVVLALVIVFGSVSVVSAYSIATDVHTNRTSNTSARVIADVTYSTIVTSTTTKMTLQEKYNGSWRTATGVPVKTVSQTKSNTRGLALPYTFKLVKGKVYRIKAVFTSKKGTTTKTATTYTGAF